MSTTDSAPPTGGAAAVGAPAPPRAPRFPRTRRGAKQLALALVTLLIISAVTFVATSGSGREVAMGALGREATNAQLDAYAHEHGLDRPVVDRYADWLGDFVVGDWGVSPITNTPVRDDVWPRFEKTFVLTIVSLLAAVPVAVLLGLYMARRRGRAADRLTLTGTIVLAALPEFVVGIGLIMIFAVWLGWLPVDSTGLAFGDLGDHVKAYVLPTLTLMLAIVPYIARITRATLAETLGAPYTRAAVLRGLTRRRVIWRHAMRNASVPLVNVVAINLVYLLSGVIVVENVFAFPGIGQALVSAINQSDYITVQAIAVVLGALFIAISYAADLLILYLNPRLRSGA